VFVRAGQFGKLKFMTRSSLIPKILIFALISTSAWLQPLLAEEAGSHEEGYHMHHFNLLAGESHADGKNGFAIGGEYEFRFHHRLGMAVTGEHVGQDFRESVVVFTPVVHPWKQLWLAGGPGFDHKDEAVEVAEAAGEGGMAEKRTRGLFRVGGGYTFELGRGFTIGPDLAVDFLSGEQVLVYGVSFGWGFKEILVRH
jgi:hypothetical protein